MGRAGGLSVAKVINDADPAEHLPSRRPNRRNHRRRCGNPRVLVPLKPREPILRQADARVEKIRSRVLQTKKENIMSKKVGLICLAVATAAVLCAVPISLNRSATSGIVVSVGQAQAYYGHYRRVARRTYRRNYYYHHHY
jgi:hypothetical protein